MNKRVRVGILIALVMGTLLSIQLLSTKPVRARVAQSTQSQRRRVGEVPSGARTESFVSYMAASEQIRMILSFEVRDEAALQQALADLYDPSSPMYHKWLTPGEFGKRFGRTRQEFRYALKWLRQQGFDVDRAYENRLSIGFTGSVDVVQRAFNVEMANYWDADKGRAFYSNMAPPVLPPEIDAITARLEGLNNSILYQRASREKMLSPLTQEAGKKRKGGVRPDGTTGGFLFIAPNDVALLYDYLPLWNSNIKGAGQKVGVVIDSDIKDSDMTAYRTDWSLPAANVQRILYTGFTNPGLTGGEIEADLDTESISATAPAAEIDLVLIPNLNTTSISTVEQDIINQNTIKIVNESFGLCESEIWSSAEQTIFAQAAAQGIAFFASAGDEGTNCDQGNPALQGTECPACYPTVTAVGGTHIQVTFDAQHNVTGRTSEVVWNTAPGVRSNCTGKSTGGGAGGGGVCQTVSMPSYQTGAQGFAGGVPAGSKRVVPDVAAVADPTPIGLLLLNEGQLFYGGGTSQASPLWAGMMALINQSCGSPQGSPNPFLYQLGINQYKNSGAKAYLDITSGNNNVAPLSPCLPSGATGFSAGTGYDAVSGWGVPDLNVIAQSLALTLTPASQSFAANGGPGSFGVTAITGRSWTTISSNSGVVSITSVSSDSGTTASGGSGNGTVNFSLGVNSNTSNRAASITISGQPFTVLQGAAFLDVPANYLFYNEIGKLSARGVTLGCGGGDYCPDATVTRGQMAAFIIRALGDFNPPTPTSQRFADVPPSNPFYAFIDEMAVRGITLGCGGGNYCPDAPVTRDQMAAFMIRALGDFSPPTPGSQRFLDVPPSNPFYAFIDQMAVLGITNGCGGGNYCPSTAVTRGQMAAFLVRAFHL